MDIVEGCGDLIPIRAMWHCREQTLVVGLCWPFTVISLIFLVFSSIHFSRRIFSVALINSFSFLISYVEKERNGRRVKQKDKTSVMAGHYVCLMGYCKEICLHKSGNSVVIYSKSFDSKLWMCFTGSQKKMCRMHWSRSLSNYSEWGLMFSRVKKMQKHHKCIINLSPKS